MDKSPLVLRPAGAPLACRAFTFLAIKLRRRCPLLEQRRTTCYFKWTG